MSTEKYGNEMAIQIIQGEGLGYAVTDYCRGDAFADEQTAKLWTDARQALGALCDYLEATTGLEIDA
jgi:hypothetical protein